MVRTMKVLLLMVVPGFILAGSPAPAAGGKELAIRAEKIYPASGPVIENGVILIRNGKIAGLGKNLSIPAGVEEIRAGTVLPGFIDIHSHLGVYSVPNVEENSDGNESTNPVTPQVRALDSFNFDDRAIPAGRAGGVTTIVSRPGSANVIGGVSVAVKLKDAPPEQMVLQEICDLKMAIEGNPVGVYGGRQQMPSTLMAVYHLARKAFIEAQEYQQAWDKYNKEKQEWEQQPANPPPAGAGTTAAEPGAGEKKPKTEPAPPARDLGKEMLVKALRREIPVHIHCATASEIASCIRLADEFKLRLSLGHCFWAHLIVEDLAKRPEIHYNVGPPMFFGYFDAPLKFKNNPAILSRAGLKVSLQTDALGGAQQNLRELAALCVRYGMDETDALKSITLHAAEAVGLEKRIGSLEPGKDADLVLLDGDPFEFTTRIERVFIDGIEEYRAAQPAPRPLLSSLPPARSSLQLPAPVKTSKLAIRAGTALTMAGAPLRNAVILIADGRIEQIGSDLPVPPDYQLVDASGFVVMPGLISARSYLGISSNWRRQSSIDETSSPVVPELEVKHAIEPQAPAFSLSRELGITSALVTPGNRNVIGGQGVVLKTAGSVVDHMITKDRAVMVFGFGAAARRKNQSPSTRMAIAALLRENLVKAREYQAKIEAWQKEKKGPEPPRNLACEALLPVLRGELPVLIHAERRDDLLTALRIADEFQLKVIFDGAADAWKIAEELKKREIPVVLEDLFRGIGNVEDLGFNPEAPAILARAGVRLAFRAEEGSFTTPGAGEAGGDLLETAALAVKNGMPEEAALRALTIDAARIIGQEQQIGSLVPGKDADLLILRGHPFQTRSVPEAVFIRGRLVYQRLDGEHLQ